MALQEAPDSIDITDIQFKVHSKYQLSNVNASTPNYNGIDLLATASAFGLIIAGKPTTTELQVFQLKHVVECKESTSIPVRSISIPGEPYVLALSCDHTMLLVCYTAHGLSFMDIYDVQSFLSNNVRCVLPKVMVSNTDNVKVKQILWNPVIANTVAICLNDGTLGSYVIKVNSFEYNSLDKSENARCACWSPKGKQIVVAFPNGKLAQYKPDLKLAKTTPCTVALFPGSFTPIAVQWLSTYQFAIVFVEDRVDAAQSLFIVNAPKTAPPSYINYYDITYSQSGPRAPQVFLIHIMQWNLLLMASSNGTEIGILGTTESGETPLWKQYTLIDEGRAELPLTADKQDTFPIGLALETGCTHQLIIGENLIPVMPILHILSTHGFILSFNLLNFQPTRVDICSPPQNIGDQSGLHLFKLSAVDSKPLSQATTPPQANTTKTTFDMQGNLTFSIPETGATSTPAKLPLSQGKSTFGLPNTDVQQQKPAMTSLFGGSAPPVFGASTTPTFGGFNLNGSKEPAKPFAAPTIGAPIQTPVVQQNPTTNVANAPKVSTEAIKPFLTVQSNYKPTAPPTKTSSSSIVFNSENDAILRKLIKEEIDAFDSEIRASLNRSKNVQINICGKEQLSQLIKNIDELQEITTQATESTESLKTDVNSLRLILFEMHAMMAESQSKVDEYNKSGNATDRNLAVNQTHRRLVNKLQSLLAQNQARFDVFSKQLDANWSAHLQNQRENDKARMRIPTLENVYQTLEQQHRILMKEKAKINKLKVKVGVRDSSPSKIKYSYSNTDNIKANSLVDSMLSLTIGDQIKNERKSLNVAKLDALRKATLGNRQVNLIKPSRPDRKGLNSEIIIENKITDAKARKERENSKKAELEVERLKQEKFEQALKMEQAKQKEMNKPKALLQTPPTPPNKTLLPTPDMKPLTTTAKPLAKAVKPMTSTASSLFGNSTKTSGTIFGTPQITTSSTPKVPEINSAVDKTQLPFGITADRSVTKPNSGSAFGTASISATGFSFGAKTEASNSEAASSIFSFDSSTKTSPFGLTTQSKSDALNLSKPVTTTPVPQKSGLLPTPTSSIDTTKTASVTPSFNITQKPVAKSSAPLLPTPPNIQPQQIVPSSAATVSASSTSSSFKFDLGNAFSANTTPIATDKPKKDKENTPIAASVPITKTSSVGSFSFLSASSTPAAKPSSPVTSITSVAHVSSSITTQTAVPSTTSIGFSFAKASADTPIFGASTTTTTIGTTTPNAAVSSSTDPASVFPGFDICKPNVADTANAGNSLFATNSFGATAAASPSSIFGGAAQTPTTSAQTSIFGGSQITTSTSTPLTTTSPANNLFGAKSPETSSAQQTAGSNIFGAKSIDNASLSFSSFGLSSTPTSSTASSVATTGHIFASPTVTKPAQNIFGGTTPSETSAVSVFGNATPASPSNSFASNLFGNAANTANIFAGGSTLATSTNVTSPTSGSIFGGAVTPASPSSGESIFGGSASFSSPQQQAGASVFGSNTFGGGGGGGSGGFGAQTSNTTTSVFGGSFSQATTNPPAFRSIQAQGGQAATAFGSPFGQTSPQAQAGFGSPPQQQQGSGFGLSAIAQQSNPTFGSNATFGAAPTFGSPKSGFGTFANANVNTNTSFTSPQKNTLFESLGSTDNGMTFGNLAQNQNQSPQTFSGGASFSSWR